MLSYDHKKYLWELFFKSFNKQYVIKYNKRIKNRKRTQNILINLNKTDKPNKKIIKTRKIKLIKKEVTNLKYTSFYIHLR